MSKPRQNDFASENEGIKGSNPGLGEQDRGS